MAEVNPPLYLPVDGAYGADELGLPWRDVFGEGVLGSAALEVTDGAAGLDVIIAAGAAWITGDENPDAQPCYRVRNDAAKTITLGTADGSNPRIDRIVARVHDSGFSGTLNEWRLEAIAGTPSATPQPPTEPDNAITLALVNVAAGASALNPGDITDVRPFATIGGGGALSPVPTGVVLPYAGDIAPPGFLLSDGDLHNIADHPRLAALVGNDYGGDGVETFGVPDCRGRVIIGLDSLGGTPANRVTNPAADQLGGNGGAEQVALSVAQMPPHAHPSGNGQAFVTAQASGQNYASGANLAVYIGTTSTTGNTGSGQAHENMPPYLALGAIIKT